MAHTSAFILNYLRDGGFRDGMLPGDLAFLNELLTEAEYYQIEGLIKLLTARIRDNDDVTTDRKSAPRKAYRKIAHRTPAIDESLGGVGASQNSDRRKHQ